MAADPVDQYLDTIDLDIDLEDLRLDRAQVQLLQSIRRLIRHEGERTVASLDNLTAAFDELDADVAAEAAQVKASIQALQDTIDQLTAGTISQEQIDALTARAMAVDEAVQAIDTAASPGS